MAKYEDVDGKNKRVKKRWAGARGAEVADWGTVSADLLSKVVEAYTRRDRAIRFGYTPDGGAYAIGIYGVESKPYTEYIRPSEDVEQYLQFLLTAVEDD